MSDLLIAIIVGLASGVLSGAFGIGGGVLTTPAIRLLLGAPALIAVGTPLPVIIPTAISGALQYRKQDLTDIRAALWLATAGAPVAVVGATVATRVGGRVVLIGTALLVFWAASDMVLQAVRPRPASEAVLPTTRPAAAPLIAIGAIAGLYSGFFGLGGGVVLVPLMSRWLRFPIKRAVGTSLAAVALLAVPGTVTHALLGNIDWRIAAGLTLGVVPGAVLGARLTLRAADRSVRLGFAALLVGVGAWLAVSELLGRLS